MVRYDENFKNTENEYKGNEYMRDVCKIEFRDGTIKEIIIEDNDLQKAYEDNNINYEDVIGVEKVGEV